MAPISVKIILDDGAVTRTILFDSDAKVIDAHAIVKEKVPTGADGKDYGLFMTSADDELSGVWLEDGRSLDYYMLRDGDSLHYLSRVRNLRVRMLDGAVKTLRLDESKTVGDLMVVICERIGITNHDEYGLCRESEASEENKEVKPAFGTLTLKRKAQQKERDAKMEQLSKKLKTDDDVEWLDQHKTLREMGVDPKGTLLLKRRLFYSDRNVDSRDPVQLNLLYIQASDAILRGTHPVTEEQAADCKIRWVNIRDVHRRILRKKLQITPGKRPRNYKYEANLEFMKPFYRDVNVESLEELESDDNNDNEIPMFVNNEREFDDDVNDNDSDESSKLLTPPKKRKSRSSKPKKIKKRESYDIDQEEKPTTSFAFESVAPPTSDLDSSDPVDAFLVSIGATLRTFSPYHLNLAKSEIFSVVQQHDLQQIMQREGREQSNDVKVSTSNNVMYIQ